MPEERLQKILARAGYGSRRSSEELIAAGRVRINGTIAELGEKADPVRDSITVDNQPIAKAEALVYIALHKPQGVLSEVSPDEPRETVRDLVPVPGHMFIVGRLDLESEGLILLTNDGELANRLTHPRYGHEKEYRVLVGSRPDTEQFEAWRHGIVLDDGHRTAPAQVRLEGLSGKGAWLRVILNEGRKRQIREMGRLTGLPVFRIIRIRIGSLELGDLKPGQWRELRPDEVRTLRSSKPSRLPPRPARGGSDRIRRPEGRAGAARPAGGRASNDRPTTRRPAAGRTSSGAARSREDAPDRAESPSDRGTVRPGGTRPAARPARPSGSARPPSRTGRPAGRPKTSGRRGPSGGSKRPNRGR